MRTLLFFLLVFSSIASGAEESKTRLNLLRRQAVTLYSLRAVLWIVLESAKNAVPPSELVDAEKAPLSEAYDAMRRATEDIVVVEAPIWDQLKETLTLYSWNQKFGNFPSALEISWKRTSLNLSRGDNIWGKITATTNKILKGTAYDESAFAPLIFEMNITNEDEKSIYLKRFKISLSRVTDLLKESSGPSPDFNFDYMDSLHPQARDPIPEENFKPLILEVRNIF